MIGHDRANELWFDLAVTYSFHHGKMLQIVVCLEQSVPCVKFDKNAANAPNIAWKAPAQLKDNLWCSIVSRGDDRRMVLIVEGCGSEVD